MKKSDLEYGNVVEARNGQRYLVCTWGGESKKDFMRLSGLSRASFESYLENLTYGYGDCFDIVKVYENYTCSKVLWERPSKPTLTDDEKVILRNIKKNYKYIARDREGELFVYREAPYKNIEGWYANKSKSMEAFNHLFQFIKWEDGLPYEIASLLEG